MWLVYHHQHARQRWLQKPIISLQIVPRRQNFPIFISNLGCRELVHDCYATMTAKDYRLGHNISELDLSYVTSIALCNRMVQCGITYGYAFPSEASRLKQVASGIQLPSVLCNYIESVGRFVLSSGLSVVPWVDDYRHLFLENNEVQLDPFLLIEEEFRPDQRPEHWPLQIAKITGYNDATTRASRSGMKFRSVDNSDLTGSVEMVVSYARIDTMLLPKAPQIMTEAEAQLGACYRFRDYNQLEQWPGENKELLFDGFTAIPFEPKVVFSDVCVAAFKGASIATE